MELQLSWYHVLFVIIDAKQSATMTTPPCFLQGVFMYVSSKNSLTIYDGAKTDFIEAMK